MLFRSLLRPGRFDRQVVVLLPDIRGPLDLQALWVGLAACVILLVTQRYIHHLAQQTQSMGLKASAKDLFSDFLTTLASPRFSSTPSPSSFPAWLPALSL